MSTFASQENTTDRSTLLSNSLNAGLLSQRKYAFGLPKSSLTNKYKGNTRLQAKLTVGASNDPLEQEADRVADQVLAAPAHSAINGAKPSIQRFNGQSTGDAGAAPASVDRVLSGSGRPLDAAIQQDMGQRFGHDFSQVRVHTGSAAEQSAQDVNAHAYTAGHNIVFGPGGFAPGSHEGRKLIAHELTHVVQQSAADSMRANQVNKKRCQSLNVLPRLQRSIKDTSTRGSLCGGPRTCASPSACNVPDTAGSSAAATWRKLNIKIDIEANTPEEVEEDTVGHAFAEYRTSAGEVNTFGFYPDPTRPPNIFRTVTAGCVVHPDTIHTSCVDYTEQFNLSSSEYDASLGVAKSSCQSPPNYDLSSYNCTSFAITLARAAGKTLPNARGRVGGSTIGLVADNPNTLVDSLRDRDIPTRRLTGDTEIREWVGRETITAIRALPVTEIIRLIDRLMTGWVSEEDMVATEKICNCISSTSEMLRIRNGVSHWETELNAEQRPRLHVALNRL